ncbi:hypothetical protein P4C99_12915 [Pontiellaceae bacterium B1224]|nr:hypothetical protein [Pontiellaceae bacterium B1224]
MKRIIPSFFALTALLIGLPLLGVWVAGHDISTYLEFPPRTHYVEHAPFSWPVFIGLALVILAVMAPFLIRVGRACSPSAPRTVRRTVPTWGWLSFALGILFWILAWTRFQWLEFFQLYTFTPLWICYIVAINALTYRRVGRCLLTHETRFFIALFPLSAAFWWFFEYLNRFVQNWWYTAGADFSPLQYFIAATLPFATVLPAVLSTEEWLASHPRSSAGLEFNTPIRFTKPKRMAWITLLISATGLFFIGWFPDTLFPLLWVAPLLLLMAFQCLENRPSFFPEVGTGDWRRIYRLALAALICGFFWELWNWHSLAKWIYEVPYVHRFQIFEMPLLGYAGYLPFGLECAVIAELIRQRRAS